MSSLKYGEDVWDMTGVFILKRPYLWIGYGQGNIDQKMLVWYGGGMSGADRISISRHKKASNKG